jgi:putative PIN family toxin of toxin-antitoxin system
VRVVLDTNVLISGVFFGGPPGSVLELWREGAIQIVLSPEIFDEYSRVGARLGETYAGMDVGPFLQLLAAKSDMVRVPPLQEGITDDPDDDKFFACARAAGVELIISGDSHLKNASGWQNIQVVTPAAFVRRIRVDRGG